MKLHLQILERKVERLEKAIRDMSSPKWSVSEEQRTYQISASESSRPVGSVTPDEMSYGDEAPRVMTGHFGAEAQQTTECAVSRRHTPANSLEETLSFTLQRLERHMEFQEKQEQASLRLEALLQEAILQIENSLQCARINEAIQRSLALHDVQLKKLHHRQDTHELKTTDGKLVWKVSDFNWKRRQATRSREASLIYSSPFYTSQYGYKMCACLYPNGDGLGRGTHLSLYFVLMKGEYDALLSCKWPFRKNVTLMLLDQNPIHPQDVTKSFKPDPASSSFYRPDNEMNIASGCPLLVPLSSLEGSTYARDNTLFFRIVVTNDRELSIRPDTNNLTCARVLRRP